MKWGTIEKHVLLNIDILIQSSQHKIYLLGQQGSMLEEQVRERFPQVHIINCDISLDKAHLSFKLSKEVLRMVRVFNITLIHCFKFDYIYSVILALIWSRRSWIKLYFSLNKEVDFSSLGPIKRWFKSMMLKRVTIFSVFSKVMADYLIQNFSLLPESLIVTGLGNLRPSLIHQDVSAILPRSIGCFISWSEERIEKINSIFYLIERLGTSYSYYFISDRSWESHPLYRVIQQSLDDRQFDFASIKFVNIDFYRQALRPMGLVINLETETPLHDLDILGPSDGVLVISGRSASRVDWFNQLRRQVLDYPQLSKLPLPHFRHDDWGEVFRVVTQSLEFLASYQQFFTLVRPYIHQTHSFESYQHEFKLLYSQNPKKITI